MVTTANFDDEIFRNYKGTYYFDFIFDARNFCIAGYIEEIKQN